ncbi:MAG: hypothetical protein WBE26_18640 [Phycisphaerae bacterium]
MKTQRSHFSIVRVLTYFRAMHRGNPHHYLTGRCPKGMPRGQWESVSMPKWPIWVCLLGLWFACAVFILVVLDIARTGLKPRSPALLSMICVSVLFSVSMGVLCAIPRFRERRFERTVRAHQYEVCWNCGYSLHGLPDVHNCPECGTEYEKDTLRNDWISWFAR